MSFAEDRARRANDGLLYDGRTMVQWARAILKVADSADEDGFHGRFETGENEAGQRVGVLKLKTGPMPQMGEETLAAEAETIVELNVSHPSPPFPC